MSGISNSTDFKVRRRSKKDRVFDSSNQGKQSKISSSHPFPSLAVPEWRAKLKVTNFHLHTWILSKLWLVFGYIDRIFNTESTVENHLRKGNSEVQRSCRCKAKWSCTILDFFPGNSKNLAKLTQTDSAASTRTKCAALAAEQSDHVPRKICSVVRKICRWFYQHRE